MRQLFLARPLADVTRERLTMAVPEFRFDRVPYVTLALIATCIGVYLGWQGGTPLSADALNQLGAKNRALMVECHEWWRLLSANLLHASGWHLALNCLFLFNLGGPAEAAFRRRDYSFLLLTSALGSTFVSTFMGEATSCGASGILFGVWGGLGVFGLRERRHLPQKYRRYFLGSVLPYAAIAFYLGSVTPGVDAWSHLGGVLAGSGTTFLLPARWQTTDRLRPTKLGVTLLLLALIVGASWWTPVESRELPTTIHVGSLLVDLPRGWHTESHRDRQGRITVVATNSARVAVSLTAWPDDHLPDAMQLADSFVRRELLPSMAEHDTTVQPPQAPTPLALPEVEAARVDLNTETQGFQAATTLVFVAQGNQAHMLSLTTPSWLQRRYQPLLRQIASSLRPYEPLDGAAPAVPR